jgi:hypothetical protein
MSQGQVIRTKDVYIVFTSNAATQRAVTVASRLADAMGASLTMIDFQCTPHPERPDDSAQPSGEREGLIERLRMDGEGIKARFYVCRSLEQAIPVALSPHSLIVVGGRRSWLPTRTERLRRALEAAGHFVLFVDGTATHGASAGLS